MVVSADDANRLAAEFKASPTGPHSPDLQRLLSVMRGLPIAGKHVLIFDPSSCDYVLGELTGKGGAPMIRHERVRFASTAAGEWYVFRCRLKAIFGVDVEA